MLYPPPLTSIRHSSETVIYLGLWFNVWGHAITDNIRRLWFLKSDAFKKEFKNCPLVYLPWEGRPLESQQNFRRLLEILEVKVNELQPITQPTQFDKIILPDESIFYDGKYKFTAEYRETIEHVRAFALKNLLLDLHKNIYYFHGKKLQIGEERLAEYFKSKGYEIISPEKLTFDEQLSLLINCKSFATTIGSCAHNSIFLRDGVEAIFILRSPNRFTRQMTLSYVNALKANYVDSSLSLFCSGDHYHCYIISEQLKRFFGDKFNGYEEEDFKTFLKYVKNSMRQGRNFNLGAKDYYESILSDFMAQLKQREDLITACSMPPRWETFQPPLTYQTHIHNKGWVAWQSEDQISGSLEDKLDIQAVKINFPNYKIFYSVYYNEEEGWSEEGWSEEVTNDQMAGTTGKAKPIYGMRIRLDEAGAKAFDILYRVHKFDGEWTPWAKNGETIYSHGIKLNAIQIKLEPKT